MKQAIIILLFILGLSIPANCQWEDKSISINSTLTSVDFVNNEIGFITGGNKIFKTVNGGDDWVISLLTDGVAFYEDIFVIDQDNIIAVGKDFDTGKSIITKTINSGENWIQIPVSTSAFLKSVFFTSPSIGYCTGGDGTILKSTNGGETWLSLDSKVNVNLQSIYFINDFVGIVVGGGPDNAVILKTTDGGENWNIIVSPSDKYLQSVCFSNEETAYIVGWNGEIIKTENCGETWIFLNSVSMEGNLEVVFTDENTGYIVGGSGNNSLIQKTSNQGIEWKDISPQISNGLISIQFPSFDVGYAVGSGGTILKTNSGGTSSLSNELTKAEEYHIYPNPTNSVLNIENNNENIIEKIIIFDSTGNKISEFQPSMKTTALDLSSYQPNIYYIELISNNKRIVKKVTIL
jgi:photosystem II stability/assembly factor-like uncharacterized protein